MVRRSYLLLPILSCLLVINEARAAEIHFIDGLTVQARVHRLIYGMEFGFGSLWSITKCGATLVRVAPASNEAIDIRVHEISSPRAMAIGEAALWVSDLRLRAIFKIDPNDLSVLRKISAPTLSSSGIIAAGEGAVWAITVEDFDRTLTRFNSRNGQLEAKITLPSSGSNVVVAYGSVWVSGFSNELYRIDPKTNTITSTIVLQGSPQDLAAGEESIWVLDRGGTFVHRIDVKSGELLASIEIGLPHSSANMTVGGGYVWVSEPGVPLTQIDPSSNAVLSKFVGGHGIGGFVRYGAGSLWIAGGRISRVQPPDSLLRSGQVQ